MIVILKSKVLFEAAINYISLASPQAATASFIQNHESPGPTELLNPDDDSQEILNPENMKRIIAFDLNPLRLPYNGNPIPQNEIQDAASLLKAVVDGLSSDSFPKVLRAIYLFTFIEGWAQCPGLMEKLLPLFQLHSNVTKSLKGCLDQDKHWKNKRTGNMLAFRKEELEYFENEISGKSYLEIIDLMNIFEKRGGVSPDRTLCQIFLVLTKFETSWSISWLTALIQKDFISVNLFLSNLPVSFLVDTVVESGNIILKLEAVRIIFKGRKELTVIGPNKYRDLIKGLALEAEGWKLFGKCFAVNPRNFPCLWTIVGEALGQCSNKEINELLSFFDSGKIIPAEQEFNAMAIALQAVNPHLAEHLIKKTLTLWKNYFRDRRKKLNEGTDKFELTSYQTTVISALMEKLTTENLKKRIRKLFEYYFRSCRMWFSTPNEFRTNLILFVSYLLPHIAAYSNKGPFDPKFRTELITLLENYFDKNCWGIWTSGRTLINDVEKHFQKIDSLRTKSNP